MTADKNMTLWNAVSRTDPANTKRVQQRGGFTAINAHSQIMEATRQFGPIGIGWGYETGEPIFRDNLIVIPVTLWHGKRENTFGPIFGGAEWINDKGRLDSDAPKKATTDAVTKGLSQLGFNADVFLGLYDDNKYVAQMAAEFQAEKEPLISDDQWAMLTQLIEGTGADTKRFCAYMKVPSLKDIPASRFDAAVKALNAKKEKK